MVILKVKWLIRGRMKSLWAASTYILQLGYFASNLLNLWTSESMKPVETKIVFIALSVNNILWIWLSLFLLYNLQPNPHWLERMFNIVAISYLFIFYRQL